MGWARRIDVVARKRPIATWIQFDRRRNAKVLGHGFSHLTLPSQSIDCSGEAIKQSDQAVLVSYNVRVGSFLADYCLGFVRLQQLRKPAPIIRLPPTSNRSLRIAHHSN